MKSDYIQVKLFSSGYCLANRKFVFPDKPSERIRFHSIWALIQHPLLGYILFDTGYSDRFYSATKYFPQRIYRWITPVTHITEDSCINKLKAMHIPPEKIDHIVISHFHADHIGGLKDFPDSKIWCARKGLNYAVRRNPISSVLTSVLKSLIPANISERTLCPEEQFKSTKLHNLIIWKWSNDLYFVDLPGHFKGQLGLLVKNSDMGDILLCADAVWSASSIINKIYPSRLISIVIDNYSQLSETIDNLHTFYLAESQVTIIPSHCEENLKLINP